MTAFLKLVSSLLLMTCFGMEGIPMEKHALCRWLYPSIVVTMQYVRKPRQDDGDSSLSHDWTKNRTDALVYQMKKSIEPSQNADCRPTIREKHVSPSSWRGFSMRAYDRTSRASERPALMNQATSAIMCWHIRAQDCMSSLSTVCWHTRAHGSMLSLFIIC